MLPLFEQATGASLAPGIKLLVRARPVFKPQYGLTLEIDAIDLEYTLGDLEARKRDIRARLQKEGCFDAQRHLVPPWDYQAVLVIAPAAAAVLKDFQAEAQRLAGHGVCHFVYAQSRFQGEGAGADIVKALRSALTTWSAERGPAPDAVVSIRGGGAVNDLAWLNDYALARFLCDLPIPVLTGIGHERDNTVLDEIAHASFDTPSKVIANIELLISRRAREARAAFDSIVQDVERATDRARRTTERFDADVRAGAMRQLERARRYTTELHSTVQAASMTSVHRARHRSHERMAEIREGALGAVVNAQATSREALDLLLGRAGAREARAHQEVDSERMLLPTQAHRSIVQARERTQALVREVIGQGPGKTLGRGFAIVRDEKGAPVTKIHQLLDGQPVALQLGDGAVAARITKEGHDDNI